MLGVEVNGPDPVRLPVRAKTEGVYREVVGPVATRRCSGLMDQADGHAVIGVDATAVLVKRATEGRRELREHERQVVLAAGTVPGPGARAIFPRDIVGVEVETRSEQDHRDTRFYELPHEVGHNRPLSGWVTRPGQ